MIRNLLATTAVATLIASGAFAQTQAPAPADPAAPATERWLLPSLRLKVSLPAI